MPSFYLFPLTLYLFPLRLSLPSHSSSPISLPSLYLFPLTLSLPPSICSPSLYLFPLPLSLPPPSISSLSLYPLSLPSHSISPSLYLFPLHLFPLSLSLPPPSISSPSISSPFLYLFLLPLSLPPPSISPPPPPSISSPSLYLFSLMHPLSISFSSLYLFPSFSQNTACSRYCVILSHITFSSKPGRTAHTLDQHFKPASIVSILSQGYPAQFKNFRFCLSVEYTPGWSSGRHDGKYLLSWHACTLFFWQLKTTRMQGKVQYVIVILIQ